MKIAIPTNKLFIAEHFGYCKTFSIIEIENNKIKSKMLIENSSDHQPGSLPKLLKSHDINLVIACGIGQKAIHFFNDINIEVIAGVKGLIKDILQLFLAGELKEGKNGCIH